MISYLKYCIMKFKTRKTYNEHHADKLVNGSLKIKISLMWRILSTRRNCKPFYVIKIEIKIQVEIYTTMLKCMFLSHSKVFMKIPLVMEMKEMIAYVSKYLSTYHEWSSV